MILWIYECAYEQIRLWWMVDMRMKMWTDFDSQFASRMLIFVCVKSKYENIQRGSK